MTPADAKKILLLRRGPADDADPQVAEALEVARHDPVLREWLRAHEQFQKAMTGAFRQIPVPPGLAPRILAHAPAERLDWWRRFPAWAAMAAAAVVVLVMVLSRPGPEGGSMDGDSFATFRSRMVRSVLRQYQMDIETNNMALIRQFLATNQAPADYVLKGGLSRLPPRGAGLQSWQAHRVAMVCLDTQGQGTAILFVVNAQTLKSPPPAEPVLEQVSKLMTASWTANGRVYLLMVDNPAVNRARLEQFL